MPYDNPYIKNAYKAASIAMQEVKSGRYTQSAAPQPSQPHQQQPDILSQFSQLFESLIHTLNPGQSETSPEGEGQAVSPWANSQQALPMSIITAQLASFLIQSFYALFQPQQIESPYSFAPGISLAGNPGLASLNLTPAGSTSLYPQTSGQHGTGTSGTGKKKTSWGSFMAKYNRDSLNSSTPPKEVKVAPPNFSTADEESDEG